MDEIKQIKDLLEKAQEYYLVRIQTIANTYFEIYVKPYCDKNKINFSNGMGSWWFSDNKVHFLYGHYDDEKDSEIKNMVDILNIKVPGGDNTLGEFMPEYKKFSKRTRK